MSELLVIDVWKKGTNKYTSEADYHIEVESGRLIMFGIYIVL